MPEPTVAGTRSEKAISVVATAFSRLGWLFILILAAVPRLTSLNRFLIVDEPGRWEWARQFFIALVSGNPAGTMIHGYPGVLPDWLSSVWIGLNALWRSGQQGEWLGDGDGRLGPGPDIVGVLASHVGGAWGYTSNGLRLRGRAIWS